MTMCTGTLPLPARRDDATGRRRGQPTGGVARDGAGVTRTGPAHAGRHRGRLVVRDNLIRGTYPRLVARDEHLDELPKVTLAFLRRVEDLCPRRVAFEHQTRRGNRPAPGRWRVANQLTEHARVAHIELGFPSPGAFTPLPDLVPEEREVYDAAVRWYMQLFGDRAVRSVDGDELDDWETPVPEHGLRP